MSEFHSLANLIKRLEVATTRLEDLAMSASSASAVASLGASGNVAPPGQASSTGSGPGTEEIPVQVRKHNEAVNEALEKFLTLSTAIGGPVAEQAVLLNEAVNAEKDIVHISCLAQQPDMSSAVFMKLMSPIQKAISGIGEIKDRSRGDPLFNHLSMVAEGIPAFGWFACPPTPVPYIRDMKDASQFYSNRVIADWKDKDRKHVEWVQSFGALLDSLSADVKAQFPTGLTWNPKGEKADTLIEKIFSSKAATASTSIPLSTLPSSPGTVSGPPPPPPPQPPMTFDDNGESVKKSDTSAMFAEINRGSDVTAGLRKVDKSEMTHKNPSLRVSSAVSAKKSASPMPSKQASHKPAKTSLEANKWVVENHDNNSEIIIEDTAINQAVYIFGCSNSTIRIKGKVNAVTMDSCTKCGIALDSTVSTVDLVNCRSFRLQIFNVTPTIAIDKCDGGQVYLSKECLNVEILSAKSSSINILIPEQVDSEDTDFKELAVPEQFKTTIVDGKLLTVTVEHSG